MNTPTSLTMEDLQNAVGVLVAPFHGHYYAEVHPRTLQLAERLVRNASFGGRKGRSARRKLDRFPMLRLIGESR